MREVEAFAVSRAGDPVGHLLGFGGGPHPVDLGNGSVVETARCRLDDARHDRFFLEALFSAWLRSTLDAPYFASTFDLPDLVTGPREIAVCTRAMKGGGVAVYTALGLDFWEHADELRDEVSSRFGGQYTDDVGEVQVARRWRTPSVSFRVRPWCRGSWAGSRAWRRVTGSDQESPMSNGRVASELPHAPPAHATTPGIDHGKLCWIRPPP